MLARLRSRYRKARRQAPGLRLGAALVPLHLRSRSLVRRRLRLLGVADAGRLLRELEEARIPAVMDAAAREYRELAPEYATGAVFPAEGALLYAVVRSLRPAACVETGTASGFSTTYLLAALARNEHGRLVSIDLPFRIARGELESLVPGRTIDLYDASPLPAGKAPGWAVPQQLRERWELRIGDARDLLPRLLDELDEIGLFFHDSLHSREHMLFEFEVAWPHLATGAVLVADDVFNRHDALPSFARRVGRPFSTFGNLGLIRK